MSPAADSAFSHARARRPAHARCALILGALIIAALAGGCRENAVPTPQDAGPAKPPAQPKLPVILLTGFGPFGGYGENPSWQAVSRLDGEVIAGHRIVARKLDVVWDGPLPALDEAIAEHKPVAALSFGVGEPGAYRVESLARNARHRAPDAAGEVPARLRVVAKGPGRYTATTGAAAITAKLRQKGHVVVQSFDAGQYLCEECLYSLEHLKATRYPKLRVIFCHIPPPAGTFDGTDKPVTLDALVSFIRDVTAEVAAASSQ